MLRFRRILAFSTRVHNYLFVLYLLFVAIFLFSFYFPIDQNYLVCITDALSVLGWAIIFEGLWIILSSIYQVSYSRVLALSPIILTLLRIAAYLAVAAGVDIFTTIVFKGLTI
jgi:hypothetical protein